jgi:hypothetical protein
LNEIELKNIDYGLFFKINFETLVCSQCLGKRTLTCIECVTRLQSERKAKAQATIQEPSGLSCAIDFCVCVINYLSS